MTDKTNDKVRLKSGIGSGSLYSDEIGDNLKKPSTVLANNTGNKAARGSGSVAIGQGLIALGEDQTIIGKRNKPNTTNIFQIGAGDATGQHTAFRVTNDGLVMAHGGEVYSKDGRAIMYISCRNAKDEAVRYDVVHLIGE